jgi:deferrochelatase/peroxidase EfeB
MPGGPGHRLTRRRLLAGGAATAAGAGLGAGGYLLGESHERDPGPADAKAIPFHGAHQAGIATPAQDRLHFAAFDLIDGTQSGLRDLLRTWSEAAEQMTKGDLVGAGTRQQALAPPDDTGEARGLAPASLTVTIGVGPGLFAKGRLGLEAKRPAALAPVPALPGDQLRTDRSGGDLCVQACADDPVVAFHAVRNLTRLARGTAVMRWSQLGFGRTSTTSRSQATPRNLMGFKDGTANIRGEDSDALRRHVWLGDDESPAWMRGGTFVVTRRIRMLIEVWDRAALQDQEQTIGRVKTSGAPLGGVREDDPIDLAARAPDGLPQIPAKSHVRLASPKVNHGHRILRRGYSFTDGVVEDLGQLDAGLFFIAYMRDPATFAAIQRRLGSSDALNEYIEHTSSAVFAVPPGARPGGYVGEGLFRSV